ncbi:MAG: transglutaminase-like domain-containing protein [Blastocatellia bacterium]|nr:transglutaminase-like domain-containing protein [Blastocatellia bacterium]
MNHSPQTQPSAFNLNAFRDLVTQPETQLDLAQAALHLCYLKYPELNAAAYLEKLDELAAEARSLVAEAPTPRTKIEALAHFLFVTSGFLGNEENYYDERNSFLNDVLDRRLGIPITLSLVFVEVAWRVGLNCEGVGLPGHFIVRHKSEDGLFLIDPFHGGRILTRRDCQELLTSVFHKEVELTPDLFRPVTKRQILVRMLGNLKNIYLKAENWKQVLRVIEMTLTVEPTLFGEVRDRGLIYAHLKKWSAAIDDLTFYCDKFPNDENLETLKSQIAQARRELSKWN